MTAPLVGWKLKRTVDARGEHLEVIPPKTSEAEAEVIGMAVKRLCEEYLAGDRVWQDFPAESRAWLCHLHLAAVQLLAENGKPDAPTTMAARATDVILALVAAGKSLGHLDERLASDDEDKQLAGARSVAAQHFKVKRDTLRRTHERKGKGKKR